MIETQAVRQEIERHGAELGAAFTRGDVAGVAALYAEDARLLPPQSSVLWGRQAIQEFWQGARDMGVRALALRTEEVEARGDLAYELGSATLDIRAADGALIQDTVKYVVIWKRRSSGPWQLAVDIWNSNG
jgi:uncharacterized protein (TIGR02246 family)